MPLRAVQFADIFAVNGFAILVAGPTFIARVLDDGYITSYPRGTFVVVCTAFGGDIFDPMSAAVAAKIPIHISMVTYFVSIGNVHFSTLSTCDTL